MKKYNLFIAFITLSFTGFSQTITIRDNSTREPLEKALIQDKNNNQVFTDAKGKANLSSLNKEDSIIIFSFGYTLKKVKVTTETTIDLISKSVNLDEIVLSANRKSEHKIDVPYSIEIIKQKDIEFTNPATSGDLLSNTGQVFVQRSQAGGGSPSLRGFEANKVLLVIDGVRMNNAIYRGGHLQDVMTIDPNMLERTEVVFGPSSTIYGSDALGGVM
ncbi:MAG: TonB-dependent receptor plug domain-containing protein, partial [Bacteroidia bacterium]|nr:TonB-dependent receptor plug domain-containing protein [Bacteroidia bacterium]